MFNGHDKALLCPISKVVKQRKCLKCFLPDFGEEGKQPKGEADVPYLGPGAHLWSEAQT